jgi:hypothetical protein
VGLADGVGEGEGEGDGEGLGDGLGVGDAVGAAATGRSRGWLTRTTVATIATTRPTAMAVEISTARRET